MHKRMVYLLLVLLVAFLPAEAAGKGKKKEEEKAKEATVAAKEAGAKPTASKKKKKDEKAFADVIEDFEVIEGLFTFYRDDKSGKVFMEIRPEQLGTIFMCSITREAGDGFYFDSGAMLGEFPFAFKRIGNKIQFLAKNVAYRADADAAISRAVARNLSDSIIGTAKIESAPHAARGSLLVNPASFFVQDIAMVGYIFREFVKVTSYSFDPGNSYFGAVKAFPENTEIDVVAAFKSGNPKSFPTLPDARSFQHVYHYSLSTLPESDFKGRNADDRVGHFLTMHQDYTSQLEETAYVRYVNRWNLEKAEPKFSPSKPKQAIVYWLENTIPVEYRDAVTEGILAWNEAFEAIGFKDAIVVKQQPDDADWEASDVRYSTIRWIVQPGGGYAVGPSRTNPFTGQIYDADIRVSADMIRSVYMSLEEMTKPVAMLDKYFAEIGILGMQAQRRMCDYHVGLTEQAAFGLNLIEARAGGAEIDIEQYLHDFIVHVIAHEVGHTLGLRHNFKASTIHANSELQSDAAAEVGLTGSVMDYTPVNIAAKGEVQGTFFQTHVGPYDKWAIEYAYKPYDPAGGQSESAMLNSIASRVAEPLLAYATDEDTMGGPRGMDPDSNRFDLGSDPIAYYRSRVALSEELWANIEGQFEQDGKRYVRMRRIFGRGFGQYFGAVSNISKYIGGVYHHRDHIGDPDGRLPLEPVPADRQRDALRFMTENVFGPDAFDFPPSLLNKLGSDRFPDFNGTVFTQPRIDYPIHGVIESIQKQPLNQIYHPMRMARLVDLELQDHNGYKPFTLAEVFSEVRDAIWAELADGTNIVSYRRTLQRAHLQKLIDVVVKPLPGTPEDASSLARADLKRIDAAIGRAMTKGGLDAMTEAHLDESSARIKAALEAGIQRRVGV